MTDEIRPVSGPGPIDPALDRRGRDRRHRERRAGESALVPTDSEIQVHSPTPDHTATPARAAVHPAAEAGSTAFIAQQLGQKGQKRGLRGGPPVLNAARSAYLGTEYSGPADRRPAAGSESDTDV